MSPAMEPGNIIEYIEKQKILAAVVLGVKNQRLRVLNENNREANLSLNRLSHKCSDRLTLSAGREKLVEALKETASRRKSMADGIDIQNLWEILHTEAEWIDLEAMAAFCFPPPVTADQASATVRAFFGNRTYFKFDADRFLPYTPEQVEQIKAKEEEETRRQEIVRRGAEWLRKNMESHTPIGVDDNRECIEILKSFYLFDKESPYHDIGKALLSRAGVENPARVFSLLVKLGIWDRDEDLEILRSRIPLVFSPGAEQQAEELLGGAARMIEDPGRRDLSDLSLATIDGEATLDFDDALSIEREGANYRVGIHIADVAHFVNRGDPIDRDALERGSSIYTPDRKLPMLPGYLPEDICSLKAGEKRPAVSILALMDSRGEVLESEIVPSAVKVARRLTFDQADELAETDGEIGLLWTLARCFREKRLAAGAIHIVVPEISVKIETGGKVSVSQTDREKPGRMLVAEMMILANWLMARFLHEKGLPAVFRSQPEPPNRILKNGESTLFQNCLQRKNLSRVILNHTPAWHTGLGLDAYVTGTSPIRKYFDLITQRQLRAAFGMGTAYTEEEIQQMARLLEQPMQSVGKIQFQRHRYWLLRHLEGRKGSREEAIVLDKRRDSHLVILPRYMLECRMPQPSGTNLKPGDLVQVTVQHANARNGALTVFMG